MQISDYKLIVGSSLEGFNTEVAQAIAEGWQPWQGPALAHSGAARQFAQAVVKYTSSDNGES